MAVEHDNGMAEYTVKINHDALTGIGSGKVERAPVPTDAGFRIFASQRLGSVVRKQWIVLKRKLNRPIVRQVNACPGAIVKHQAGDRQEITRLGKGRLAAACAVAKIALRIGSMAQVEPPTEVQQ